jgi:hypothetical protein
MSEKIAPEPRGNGPVQKDLYPMHDRGVGMEELSEIVEQSHARALQVERRIVYL